MCHASTSMRQQGFSLLEVLVAMIILSIGLLALTALQLNSLKTTNEARQITSVALLAKEMADRMRANPAELRNYAGVSVTQPDETIAVTACDAGCTAAELRAFDVNEWVRGLDKALKPVRGSIYRTIGVLGAPDEYTISVQWDADRDGLLAAATGCDAGFQAGKPVVDAGCYKLRFTP